MAKLIDLQLFSEGEERREEPTPRKRRKTREEGRVFQSKELVSAVLLVMLFMSLWFLFPWVYEQLRSAMIASFTYSPTSDWSVSEISGLLRQRFSIAMLVVAPLFGVVWVVGTAATWAQTGPVFSTKPINPDLNRINPVEGGKKLLSSRALINLVKSLAKVGILGYLAYGVIAGNLDGFSQLLNRPLTDALSWTADVVWALVVRATGVLLGVSVLDYLYERHEHEKSLKMTRKELKDEMKNTEGDPQVKGRIKSLQQQMARNRMMEDVKSSDVVITNPIHYAVALTYDAAEMQAPKVVGKGRGLIAKRIREVARSEGVVIEENPPLARALYDVGAIGQSIPPELYQAVAEVLAHVWRAHKRYKGRGGNRK